MGLVVFQGFWNDMANVNPGDTPDLRSYVLMDTTTVEAEEDAETVADFTTLAELDGFGYSRADLSGVAITYETSTDPNHVKVDFDDDSDGWGTAVSPGTDPVGGTLIARHVDGAGGNIPWFWTTEGAIDPNGGLYGWSVPAGGFAILTRG